MSAESPRRVSRSTGQIVRPQPISDKSVMESVVDFIHDVVPQAYSGTGKIDEKESVLWVRFAYSDISDLNLYSDGNVRNGNVSPLLIILGYSNAVQIWLVPANGEAQEVLSWRQGAVKCFCMLPTPQSAFHSQDIFAQRRPLIVFCDGSSPGQQFSSVYIVSLKTGDQVHSIKFKTPVCNIRANKRVLVMAFQERIAVFDACTFKDRFSITSCFPCPGPNPNPIALGPRWLAYADKKLVSVHQTCGGMAGDGVQSYAATVIHAAKTISKGLTMFGETVASSLTGTKSHVGMTKKEIQSDSPQPGIVTIIDIQNAGEGEVNVHEDSEGEGIIAHFLAHANEPVSAMEFDVSGVLLLTADKLGHNFHLFRILPHPGSSSLGAVHHLYTLYRGDTMAKVQDIAFSIDSRWVAVSTLRGTTHIFPITPYGGPITVRTHTSPKVVNRLSRFQKSAGLEEISSASTGRSSPSLSGSPSSSSSQTLKSYDSHPCIPYHNTMCGRMGNPRLPPYPHPTFVNPLSQLRQPLSFPHIGSTASKSPPTAKSRGSFSNNGSENVNVVAIFAPPRAWLVGSPSVSREKGGMKRAVDALYVLGCHGNLLEYSLEPKPCSMVPKPCDDSAIELEVQPRAQWNLISRLSSPEVKPPLPSTNPLMLAQEFIYNAQKEKEHGHLVGKRSRLHRGIGTQTHSGSEGEIEDESWLSQVEIITHAGPPRRLWMGPQFSFKTFQQPANTTILSSTSSALLSQSSEMVSTTSSAMDIFTEEVNLESLGVHPTRSNPVAMPSGRQSIPLLIEAGSGSFEQPPGLLEVCGNWQESGSVCSGRISENLEDQLKENLADAMVESPVKESGNRAVYHESSTEFQESMDELSSSSSHSGSVSHAFDARSSPPHSIEHVLVFPTDNGSPSSS